MDRREMLMVVVMQKKKGDFSVVLPPLSHQYKCWQSEMKFGTNGAIFPTNKFEGEGGGRQFFIFFPLADVCSVSCTSAPTPSVLLISSAIYQIITMQSIRQMPLNPSPPHRSLVPRRWKRAVEKVCFSLAASCRDRWPDNTDSSRRPTAPQCNHYTVERIIQRGAIHWHTTRCSCILSLHRHFFSPHQINHSNETSLPRNFSQIK